MLTRKGPSHLGPINLMANSTPTTIKKYANRRLYNTASSAYVTLADLAKMVKGGEDFVVYDAKSNEDITRSVLTQIIFEQEGIEGQSLLPTTFLRQLIRFYGDSMQAILPSYLEFSIDKFTRDQQKFRDQIDAALGSAPFGEPTRQAFHAMEEQAKKNMAVFRQALSILNPFGVALEGGVPLRQDSEEPAALASPTEVDELKRQIAELNQKVDKLSGAN